MPRKKLLKDVKRIVIKVGTSSITEEGLLSSKKINRLVADITELRGRGYKIVLVSSGAISAGAGLLKKNKTNLTIQEKQALAAIGQTALMNEYRKRFEKKGILVGQILLTEDDVKHRRRFLNARNTMNALFTMGMLPIVNENDTVVVKEIKFGDNDTLSAHVANIVDAELLILLSDVKGLYKDMSDTEPLDEVNRITPEIQEMCGESGTKYGTGGMYTKIKAAEMILDFGENMIIAPSALPRVLNRIMDGERIGTLFTHSEKPLSSKKKWLSARTTRGEIVIDDGAVAAVRDKNKSLLATGVKDVKGNFDMGEIVAVVSESGDLIAKGVVKYNTHELNSIKGKKSQEIKKLFGIKYFEEVIHKNDILVIKNQVNGK